MDRKSPDSALEAVMVSPARNCASVPAITSANDNRPSPAVMPSRSRVMVAGSAPVSRAAVSVMISYNRMHAKYRARPATVVPADANAPVSYTAPSVSPKVSTMRSGPVFRVDAAIWVCTVVVPLPNSQVPTPIR